MDSYYNLRDSYDKRHRCNILALSNRNKICISECVDVDMYTCILYLRIAWMQSSNIES